MSTTKNSIKCSGINNNSIDLKSSNPNNIVTGNHIQSYTALKDTIIETRNMGRIYSGTYEKKTQKNRLLQTSLGKLKTLRNSNLSNGGIMKKKQFKKNVPEFTSILQIKETNYQRMLPDCTKEQKLLSRRIGKLF